MIVNKNVNLYYVKSQNFDIIELSKSKGTIGMKAITAHSSQLTAHSSQLTLIM